MLLSFVKQYILKIIHKNNLYYYSKNMILIKERRLVDEIYRNIKKNTYIGNYQYFWHKPYIE